MSKLSKTTTDIKTVVGGSLSSCLTGAAAFVRKTEAGVDVKLDSPTVESRYVERYVDYHLYACSENQRDLLDELLMIVINLKNLEQGSDGDTACSLMFSYFIGVDPGLRPSIVAQFRTHNIDFKVYDWTRLKELTRAGVDEIVNSGRRFDFRHVIALYGIFVLSLAKNLSSDNYENWVKARLRGITAKLGIPEDQDFLRDLCPGVCALKAVYEKSPAFWTVRKVLVHHLQSIKTRDSQIGAMAKWTLNLLQWAECTHLRTIITELVIKRGDVLSISEFRGELPYLTGALKMLGRFGEDFALCKLLTDPSIESNLPSRHYPLMTAVAWKLQNKHKVTTENQTSYYKGMKVSESDPHLQSAMAKIYFYDTQMKMQERSAFDLAYGTKVIEKYEKYIEHLNEDQKSDED